MWGVPAVSGVLPFIVVGVASGSVYALAGMGLTLTFKTSGIVNFAHGAQAALAAFLMFELRQRVGVPWPVAAMISLLVAGVAAGLVLERLAVALADTSPAARVAAMVGVLVAVQGSLVAVFGSATLQMRFFLPTHLVRLPGVNVRAEQLIVSAVAAVGAIGLAVFFARTRIGAATQAVVVDPDLLGLEGVSPERTRRVAWIIGSCFAALAGLLIAPRVGLDAGVLTELVFFAFGAAAVGAFRSLPLTYAGGIGIGVGAALLTKYLNTTGPIAALPSTLPVIVLFGALLAIPRDWLADRGRRIVRPALPPIRFAPTTVTAATLATGVGAVIIAHAAGSRISTYTTALGFVVLFASLALLVRTSGQVSLCHIAFAAVGATTFARALGGGWPWFAALAAAALVAAAVGALVAIPAIRLPGLYLGVATLAFGLLVQDLVYPSFLMFGGSGTILPARRPSFASTDTGYFFVAAVVAALGCSIVVAVHRGRLGRLLAALSEQPAALDAHGVSANVTRLIVFGISAALAGVGGALLAPVTGVVTPIPFDFTISLLLVSVLFIAGRQPILGAVLAAGLYIVVPSYLTSGTAREYVPVVFGAAAVLTATAGGRPILERVARSPRTVERSRGPVRRPVAST